jgi:hypothetical protein
MDGLPIDLLLTNVPPTNLQSDSVRQLILNCQKDALGLRVQYRGRKTPLDIITRRENALRSIAAWKVVLSPVRHIPCEILGEIFPFCVDVADGTKSTDDPRESPILMSHICSRWRDVALNTPRLWDSLVFLFPRGFPKRAVPILRELVHRSTPHQLTTYISSDSFSVSHPPDILSQLIAIPEFNQRIQKLDLTMPIPHFQDLMHIPIPHFPGLTTLRLDICISTNQKFVGRILNFFKSPRLRELSIRCTYWTESFFIALSPHFPWAQLVDLDLDLNLRGIEVIRILAQCTNLRRCGLLTLTPPYQQLDLALCTLPSLQDLAVDSYECTSWLFEFFRFPNLTHLDLTINDWPAEALSSFQTVSLTHLSLHYIKFDAEDGVALVLRFLAQNPTIEHLQLHEISESKLIDGLTSLPSNDTVLLPRLEVIWLKIDNYRDSIEPVLCDEGEGLVEMIESRWYLDLRPSGAPPCAQLRDVCLELLCPKFSVSVLERLADLEEDGVFRWWD